MERALEYRKAFKKVSNPKTNKEAASQSPKETLISIPNSFLLLSVQSEMLKYLNKFLTSWMMIMMVC
jgi:hypothetical protein